jgi:hypothetical protein
MINTLLTREYLFKMKNFNFILNENGLKNIDYV